MNTSQNTSDEVSVSETKLAVKFSKENKKEKQLESNEGLAVYSSFDDMGLSDDLLRGIYAKGWEKPTYIQSKAIMPMGQGRDTLAQAESGMGKTGAFTVGGLHRIEKGNYVQLIILSPTRELADQTWEISCELSRFMVERGTMEEPMLMRGGLRVREMMQSLRRSQPQVVIATPGRLLHMIESGCLVVDKAKTVVLDECDDLLERGFRDSIYEIFQYLNPKCQIGCFSATMPEDVVALTKKFMREDYAFVLKPPQELTLKGIKQFWVEVLEDQKADTLIDLFETLTLSQSMIFINSRNKIDQLADYLRQNDYPVGVIHAGLDRDQRKQAMVRFRKGLDRVMLCSDVVARGVDIAGVSIVVNYDLPNTRNTLWKDDYLHRIGRSGRHGKKGVSINFLSNEDDAWTQKELEKHYHVAIEEMPNDVDKYLGGN